MATSKQEKTYNEIVEYYNHADLLISAVEEVAGKISEEQFKIIEETVEALEKYADQLTAQYIEYVKNGDSPEAAESIKTLLEKISAKIEECQNKVLMIYNSSKNE